jgi:hypothetical protein
MGEIKYTWSVQKETRTFFLKHLLISLQLNKTCLLQSTPLHCLYTTSNFFFQFWNTSWNAFCRIAHRSHSEFSSISSIVWNQRPFRVNFNLGNKKSLQGPNLESRGVGARQSSRASPKIHRRGATCEHVRCRGAESRSCVSIPQTSSFALPPSNALWPPSKTAIDCLTTWNKFMMKDALPIKKKKINHAFTFDRLWHAFFWSRRRFSHPLWRLSFCFDIVPVHPRFITC